MNYGTEIFSQEGEDIILLRLFGDQRKGFFVDVGSHHPIRFSNTYLFYLRGWSGINIEPNPGIIKEFNRVRPRDINLELAVSNEGNELTYYIFNEPALNSFDKELSLKRDGSQDYKIVNQVQIKTYRLESILDEHLPIGQKIDYLTIDVEGLDYDVLLSNNWDKYKPTYVLTEEIGFDLCNAGKSKIYNFMIEKKYNLICKTCSTLLFQKNVVELFKGV